MARKSKRAALALTPEQRVKLRDLSGSRTASAREVERAKILLGYADGISITELQRRLGFSRPNHEPVHRQGAGGGRGTGLKDKYHRPKAPEITPEGAGWVVSLACTQPKDHGLAAELWTLSALAGWVRAGAVAAGHGCLHRSGQSDDLADSQCP